MYPRKPGDFPGLPAVVVDVAVGASGQRELDKKIHAYFAKAEGNLSMLIVVEVNEDKPSFITVATRYSVRDHVRNRNRAKLSELSLGISLGFFIPNERLKKEALRLWPEVELDLIVTIPYKRILDACICPLSAIALTAIDCVLKIVPSV